MKISPIRGMRLKSRKGHYFVVKEKWFKDTETVLSVVVQMEDEQGILNGKSYRFSYEKIAGMIQDGSFLYVGMVELN